MVTAADFRISADRTLSLRSGRKATWYRLAHSKAEVEGECRSGGHVCGSLSFRCAGCVNIGIVVCPELPNILKVGLITRSVVSPPVRSSALRLPPGVQFWHPCWPSAGDGNSVLNNFQSNVAAVPIPPRPKRHAVDPEPGQQISSCQRGSMPP